VLAQELREALLEKTNKIEKNLNKESRMQKYLGILTAVVVFAFAATASAAPIMSVDYFTLTGTGLITFDDIAGGDAPGTNYDAVFESGGADFGERFAGQTLGFSGDFDVLAGSPTGPLGLVAGAADQNLNVFMHNDATPSHVLTGLGPLGFPNFNSIGEGAFAVLFDFDQSEFGFELVGGEGGNAYVSFFRRDGSLIDNVTVSGLGTAFYGFEREGGVNDIAGISIYNDDPAGIGFDDLKHDVPGVPNDVVPEPGTLALLGLGLAGAGFRLRRKK
jgi:hypothetical protein